MKVLVFSDSHGSVDLLDKAISDIKPDLIYGLGDFGFSIYDILDRNILGVIGNNPFDPELPINRVFDLEGFNIMLTHGHTHSVRSGLLSLSYFSKENNVDICFYGHTHIANIEYNDGCYYINPGSITLPYIPEYKTFIIMDIKEKLANIKIVDAITYNIYKEINIKKD